MRNNEWSLILFTLISQLCVGVLLLFSCLYFAYPDAENVFNYWWKSPELWLVVLLGIAGFISLLHLGNPMNVTNSVNNLMGSWISKEVVSLAFLIVSISILFLIRWIIPSPLWLLNLMVIISAIAGIVFIYSMSQIYMIETIPSWNNWNTPVSFFSTVYLFSIISLIIVKTSGLDAWGDIIQMKPLLLILFVFLLFQITISSLHHYKLSGFENAGIEGRSFTKGNYYTLFIIRTIVLNVLAVCVLYIYINSPQLELNSMLILLLVIALISQELLGRMLFYRSYFRIGV